MRAGRVLTVPSIAALAVAGGIAAGGCGSSSSADITSEAKQSAAMTHDGAMKSDGDGAMKHHAGSMKQGDKGGMKHNHDSMKQGSSMKDDGSSSSDQMSH